LLVKNQGVCTALVLMSRVCSQLIKQLSQTPGPS